MPSTLFIWKIGISMSGSEINEVVSSWHFHCVATCHHHLTLHFRTFLEQFSPTHLWCCFPFERYNYVMQHFSHPFLGTYEVHQFLDLGHLEGTPFHSDIWAPYQYHHTMECKTHTIPHSYQYHVTYHTIPYHTIPYHLTSYHTMRGVWGPFTKYEKYFYRLQYLSVGLHLLWTGSSDFCCHFKLQVEAIGWNICKQTASVVTFSAFVSPSVQYHRK